MCKPNPFFAFFGSIWLVVGGALVPYLLFSEPQDFFIRRQRVLQNISGIHNLIHVGGLSLSLHNFSLDYDELQICFFHCYWHDIPTWSGEILWFLIPFEIALNSPLMVWVTTAYIRTYPTWSEGTLGYTLYWWIREE
ncbi:uncharacterized protein LOC108022361 isoform X2 [Drosophila biarmipes]|uniref:uncharacterized protein LOC108022361 isoform X2 n=1 Tax=Drosophila biarmipes TaxID=125945 RepID=UPI0021CD15AD|nr:uncharacterized protein LOC108022361 isoform X2 [Drosophila biarmipes]